MPVKLGWRPRFQLGSRLILRSHHSSPRLDLNEAMRTMRLLRCTRPQATIARMDRHNPALHELTATEALRLMRAGRLSPVALVEALLERIAARNVTLQAWVSLDRDGAIGAARDAERAWREGRAAPLCGIPLGVKDLLYTRGLPTGANFAPFRDRDPGVDATCIAQLREAGAIVLGKVETTQFAGRDPSRARNPWNSSAPRVARRAAPPSLSPIGWCP